MDDEYVTQPERIAGTVAGQHNKDVETDEQSAVEQAGLRGMKNKSITDRLFNISSKLEDYLRSIDVHRVQGEPASSSSSSSPYAHTRTQPHNRPERTRQELDRDLGGYVNGLMSETGRGRYCRKDEETLLLRLRMGDDWGSLAGGLDAAGRGGDGMNGRPDSDEVDLILLYEPEDPNTSSDRALRTTTTTDSESDPLPDRSDWKLYNIVVPPAHPTSSSSTSTSGFGGSTGSGTTAELDEIWTPVIPTTSTIVGAGGAGGGNGSLIHGQEDKEGAGEVGEMGGQAGDADDFWGGYEDDDDTQPQAQPHDHDDGDDQNPGARVPGGTMAIDLTDDSPPPTTQPDTHPHQMLLHHPPETPSLSFPVEDDSYWASYGSVEDGLRASNPPTPGGSGMGGPMGMAVGRHFTPTLGRQQGAGMGMGEKDYWGTGGETPVGW